MSTHLGIDHDIDQLVDDLLDDLFHDQVKHAYCRCQDAPPGVLTYALCGHCKIRRPDTLVFPAVDDLPPGSTMCPDCLALIDGPCPRCGATWS